MTSRTHPAIATLEIYTDEGQVVGNNLRLPPGSTRYQHVEYCVHLALRVLETKEGRDALVKTATQIVSKHRQKKKPTLYQGDFADMPKWIDFFLTKVRSDFPMLYLSHTKSEAVCVRQQNDIKKLGDFSPKHIGYMDINRYIVNNMIVASQKNDASNLTRFRFLLTISISHEIVHLLTGFLAGEKANKLYTPPDTSAKGYGTYTQGEAGRFMEELLFGGQTEMWMNPQDPAGVIQAGIPYLLDDGLTRARARLINPAYIDKFVKGVFSFPIFTEGSRDQTTREALRKGKNKEMADVRWSAAKNAAETSSPPRASGAAADRRNPPGVTNGKGLKSSGR